MDMETVPPPQSTSADSQVRGTPALVPYASAAQHNALLQHASISRLGADKHVKAKTTDTAKLMQVESKSAQVLRIRGKVVPIVHKHLDDISSMTSGHASQVKQCIYRCSGMVFMCCAIRFENPPIHPLSPPFPTHTNTSAGRYAARLALLCSDAP